VELFDYMNDILQKIQSTETTSTLLPFPSPISLDMIHQSDPQNNCTDTVKSQVLLDLLQKKDHQLFDLKSKLEIVLKTESSKLGITSLEEKIFPSPLVTVGQNFDSLLIPNDHYCRRASDVYYVNSTVLLRTHLTAYLSEIMSNTNAAAPGKVTSYYITGPIFRRLEEDNVNSELSHQLEFVSISESVQESAYVDTAANVVQAFLPPNPKLRWEELDETPYLSETMMGLETLYQDKALELARGGLLSPEVTFPFSSFCLTLCHSS
jgi:phenylalanyl-tRNA synthetase alpha subunit